MEYVDIIPKELLAKREELETAIGAVIKAGDSATPEMFTLAHSLRREYDREVQVWLLTARHTQHE